VDSTRARPKSKRSDNPGVRRLWPAAIDSLFVQFAAARAAPVAPAEERLTALLPALAKNLRQNIVPFWFPRSVDPEHGGYTVHYGPNGEPLSGGTKALVTQARMLWLASRLMRTEFAVAGLRAAADAGFGFLRDRMWDTEHGGFFWEVDPTGTKLLRPHKHLYGQAFALYALSEYYLATSNSQAIALANRLFDLVDGRAHDAEYGGYREFFARDWSAPPPDVTPYLGPPADHKRMNTHLHLTEALITYLRAGAPPSARDRLSELVAILSQGVVRKGWVACTDRHRRDWTPVLDSGTRVSYGHDLENIWFIVDALRTLDQPVAPYCALFRDLFEYALRYGYDRTAGGFFDRGLPRKAADRRSKIWWVQAEALVSALTMFELTREPLYVDVFERTWRFVDSSQTDWSSGEWHEAIDPDGRPRAGNKAHPWKAGYHNGRALIEAVERIRLLTTCDTHRR
jgi:cellobiose epimerase